MSRRDLGFLIYGVCVGFIVGTIIYYSEIAALQDDLHFTQSALRFIRSTLKDDNGKSD